MSIHVNTNKWFYISKNFGLGSNTTTYKTEYDLPLAISIDGSGLCPYLTNGQVRKLVNEVGNLGHLASQIVSVAADGLNQGQFTVSSGGEVVLSTPAATVHVGLPYTGKVKFNPLGGDTQAVSEGKKRKLYDVMLRLFKSLGGQFTKDESKIYNLPVPAQDKHTVLFTGDLHNDQDGSFFESVIDVDWEPEIIQNQPLPFMILAAVLRSEISEDK